MAWRGDLNNKSINFVLHVCCVGKELCWGGGGGFSMQSVQHISLLYKGGLGIVNSYVPIAGTVGSPILVSWKWDGGGSRVAM